MNNLDNIIKLIEAGYTKEEINALMVPSAEDPKPEDSKEDTSTEEHEDEPTNDGLLADVLKDLNKRLNDLDNSIKKANLSNSSFNMSEPESAEQILAKILVPDDPSINKK